ncbi:MAG: hypothetical protein NTV12_00115 [Verrucomicrobia bacterium]|nr:hypothetical protein [Verrucomicrobiota bacterium]
MTKPLAMVFYERLLLGSQLVNRLTDVGYRAQSLSDLATVPSIVRKEKPLVLLMDLFSAQGSVADVIATLKQSAETAHIPIIGFTAKEGERLHPEAVGAGVDMVAFDEALLRQLPEMLEQVLLCE